MSNIKVDLILLEIKKQSVKMYLQYLMGFDYQLSLCETFLVEAKYALEQNTNMTTNINEIKRMVTSLKLGYNQIRAIADAVDFTPLRPN